MAIYLVDYENAKNLLGIDKLSAEDNVVIFYSKKASSLTFDLHQEILSTKANIEYKCAEVGGLNALDFQLSSYLGYCLKQNEGNECEYYIVAKDGGYSYVKEFWKKEKGIDIQLIPDLTGEPQSVTNDTPTPQPKKKTVESKKPNDVVVNVLKESKFGLSDAEVKEIAAIVAKYKTTTTINNNLSKLLKDSAKAGEILKILKPYIKK